MRRHKLEGLGAFHPVKDMGERVCQVDSSPGSTVLLFDVEILDDTCRVKSDISFIPKNDALFLQDA